MLLLSACRQAVRRVLDRERKWLWRGTFQGQARRPSTRPPPRDAALNQPTQPARRAPDAAARAHWQTAPVRGRWPCPASSLTWDQGLLLGSQQESQALIPKHILVPDRLRRPPTTGWSWLDRRFLREHGDHLSRDAMLLYLFLGRRGRPARLVVLQRQHADQPVAIEPTVLERARQELLDRDLIAYQLPLVQVLALPRRRQPPLRAGPGADPARRAAPPGATPPPADERRNTP